MASSDNLPEKTSPSPNLTAFEYPSTTLKLGYFDWAIINRQLLVPRSKAAITGGSVRGAPDLLFLRLEELGIFFVFLFELALTVIFSLPVG